MRPQHRRSQRTAKVFDAASEEPGLLEADRQARAERSRAARSRAARAPSASAVPESPIIDSRLAARREQVEADAAEVVHRRRHRRLVGVAALTLVVGAGAVTVLSPLAGVRTIEVTGASRTGSDAVRSATGLGSGAPLVRIDISAVAARVAAMPWVRRVTVERRWPRTVVLTVEERTAVAVTPCQTVPEGCLVDRSGRVLGPLVPDDGTTVTLPRLVGLPVAGGPGAQLPESSQGALAVAAVLPSALRPLVAGVRGEGAEVSLDLDAPGRASGPPVVRLGPPDRVPEKLTAAATVLARTSVNTVAVLDVRVPDAPALTRIRR